jgi:hypothetical protein
MGLNLVKDELHQALALITESIVDVTALDQEHVHSDFERHGLRNLVDALLIHVDFLLELLSGNGLLVDKGFDSFSLLKDEEEFVIDVGSKAHNLKVFSEGLRDFFFGLDHNLVVDLNIPKMHLVRSGNCIFWSWKVATLLDDLVNNLFKLLLNLFDWGIKHDLWTTTTFAGVVSIWNTKLQGDKVVFKWGIGIIFSLDDLIWLWISWELVSLDEFHICVN